jgi:hypothetical protein
MELDINATDVDSGLEFLPTEELFYFTCGDMGRANAGVSNIKQLCRFSEEEAISNDFGVNLIKVGRINQIQHELQNRIEIQTNRRVRFRN